MPEPRSRPGNDQPEARPGKRQPAFSLAPPLPEAPATPSFDDPGGDLPAASGGNRFACVPRDPRSIFVYWELALPICRIPGARLAIAVHRADGTHETTCPLGDSSGTRFLTVAGTDTRYQLTLGYLPVGAVSRDDMILVLAERGLCTQRDRPASPAVRPHSESRRESILEGPREKSAEIRKLLFPEGGETATSGSSH